MGRWVGIDYGTRRIGLALANPTATIASPATTIDASGIASNDARTILAWALRNEAAGLVLGLPLNMDGSDSQQTRLTRALAEQLRVHGDLPVELWDERLSSYQADLLLEAGAVRPARRKRLRDALAAQVILQSFLDARRAEGQSPAQHPAPED